MADRLVPPFYRLSATLLLVGGLAACAGLSEEDRALLESVRTSAQEAATSAEQSADRAAQAAEDAENARLAAERIQEAQQAQFDQGLNKR
ncbi:MAG: hypothetical protein ACFB6S_06800 [Geminicoccaceae bacterium]